MAERNAATDRGCPAVPGELLVSDELRNLATALLSEEREQNRVFDRLRECVTKMAGAEGFSAIAHRALALARIEAPSLKEALIKPDGKIEGLYRLRSQTDGGEEPAVALISHLLKLLEQLIGESLTLRLVVEAFPNIDIDLYRTEPRTT